ncbi:MAG TPA: ABC transporter permease [Candidatus Marinimicrobia bacterium]|nr:ABC transporter permease [Candidatus Neomarinimicrobiota bacterium]|tara:strand:- start:5714 stop:6496 length:783 start_codon:yes stop_codon:yes gene_type:complete
MLRIIKYSFFDLMRSRWSYIYFLFYLILGLATLFLNSDISKSIIILMNITIVLIPLIGTIFGVMYYYNSIEFSRLLLAQPLTRKTIFLGQYLGLSLALSSSLILGLGIPFLLYGLLNSGYIINFLTLLVIGVLLTFIFTAISYNIALSNEDKIKGFGIAILVWLILAIVYDGFFLISMIVFNSYPLEKFALIATLFNPIDLSRILIILKLDFSALLGYTGAVLNQFYGSNLGIVVSFSVLIFWAIIPIKRMIKKSKIKDF